MAVIVVLARACLVATILILTLYAVRHYVFAASRVLLRRPRDTMELTGFVLPRISVLVPMHNEEAVAADVLQALAACDYPWERLEVLAIDDRSTDQTGEIINEFAKRYPQVIRPVHRSAGAGGKGSALQFATPLATGEILLLFDADYVPGKSLLKQLVAPFCDPEVGTVMGRVMPHNGGASLLAALLELERAAGYQIGQQVRYQFGLAPQFGGTVGGVRASALKAVGGWNPRSLTEDTDLTFRLLLRGWKVAYLNRAECYEEAPETWSVRRRQIARWATGHTECMHRYWKQVLAARRLNMLEKADALFVLACYWTAPILVLGWLASLLLFLLERTAVSPLMAVLLAFIGYQLFGNQATFFELGAAALLDRNRSRVALIPLNLLNFFASTGAIVTALLKYYFSRLYIPGGRQRRWHKTLRYRNGNNFDAANNSQGTRGSPPLRRASNGVYFAARRLDLR
jgi:cellulose synthase/poly-beta-1,6-N-acetylglucosamine synthase-like glycosyltransferase